MSQREKNSFIKLLVVLSNKDFFSRFMPQLRQLGYQLEFVQDMNQVMESIRKRPPDAIMLSWNLRTVNVVKAYTFFSDKLKVPCIVFAEDQSPRTSASLMRSRIPHTIFPPLSAPGIHRRIELLLRKKKARVVKKQPEHRIQSSMRFGAIRVLTKDIDPNTTWENVGVVEEDGTCRWKGSVTINSVKHNYYFKGPKRPIYNGDLKSWENLDENSIILMVQRPAVGGPLLDEEASESDKKLFSLFQKEEEMNNDPLSIETNFSEYQGVISPLSEGANQPPDDFRSNFLTLPTEIESELMGDGSYGTDVAFPDEVALSTDFSKSNSIEKIDPNAENGSSNREGFALTGQEKIQLQSILAKCVQTVLGNYSDSIQAGKKIEKVSRVAAMTIPSNRFKGYLLVSQANDNLDTEFISRFYKELQKRMMDVGEALHSNEEIIHIEVQPFTFKEWASASTEFVITGSLRGSEIIFAFMDLGALPHMLEPKDNFVGVDFQNWLVPDTILAFDLYLHMPMNEKYILYLKKNTLISQQTVSKFLRLNVETVFINFPEKGLFLSYCIRIKIGGHLLKVS